MMMKMKKESERNCFKTRLNRCIQLMESAGVETKSAPSLICVPS